LKLSNDIAGSNRVYSNRENGSFSETAVNETICAVVVSLILIAISDYDSIMDKLN